MSIAVTNFVKPITNNVTKKSFFKSYGRDYSASAPVDTVYQDELNALTDEECVKATINAITEFINSDGSGVLKNIIGDEFAKLMAKLKTDNSAVKSTAAAFKKMASKINNIPEGSPEHAFIMFDFFVKIGIMDDVTNKAFKSMFKTASTPKPKKENKKPQPQKEQPKVAHDLRQQKPQGFDVGNFVQQPNPNNAPTGQIKQELNSAETHQYQQMTFDQKVEYVQKRINFIPKTHPNVGESWFDALITLISDPFIQNTLAGLGAAKNPRFYEIKLHDGENNKYNIAFNVNCTDDNNRIIVRYSTNLTQQANGILGYSFDAKVVAKK